jgi:hypothetical protein
MKRYGTPQITELRKKSSHARRVIMARYRLAYLGDYPLPKLRAGQVSCCDIFLRFIHVY